MTGRSGIAGDWSASCTGFCVGSRLSVLTPHVLESPAARLSFSANEPTDFHLVLSLRFVRRLTNRGRGRRDRSNGRASQYQSQSPGVGTIEACRFTFVVPVHRRVLNRRINGGKEVTGHALAPPGLPTSQSAFVPAYAKPADATESKSESPATEGRLTTLLHRHGAGWFGKSYQSTQMIPCVQGKRTPAAAITAIIENNPSACELFSCRYVA
jgi:hypothetical protein